MSPRASNDPTTIPSARCRSRLLGGLPVNAPTKERWGKRSAHGRSRVVRGGNTGVLESFRAWPRRGTPPAGLDRRSRRAARHAITRVGAGGTRCQETPRVSLDRGLGVRGRTARERACRGHRARRSPGDRLHRRRVVADTGLPRADPGSGHRSASGYPSRWTSGSARSSWACVLRARRDREASDSPRGGSVPTRPSARRRETAVCEGKLAGEEGFEPSIP